MECVNHPGTAAAGTCTLCGKALCASCMNRFLPPACESCLTSHNAAVARRLYLEISVTIVIFLGVFAFVTFRNPAHWQAGIMFGLMFSCAYWGWQFMNRFAVPVVLTSGIGLFVYLFVKFAISVCLGFIVTPWQIFKRVKELASINALKQQLAQGKV